ncbi:uncharacterized protein LOC116163985 [Photinus pyralis]|uniref:uncharacterized protein LOC116163985 n=1 Tax=Photinus pyralis TaxID=7054 RepID=UPI00126768F2|nr:uncharacterized protein LOC116163985 [Photinus pyralis]
MIDATPRYNGISCTISFPKGNDLLQPVVLTNRSSVYNFAIPTGNNLIYGDLEPISLLYSPSNNHIEGTYTNLTSFLCSGGETLRSKIRTSDFESINCKSYVKAGISVTRTKCGRNLGNIINIGYQVSKKQFLTLITTCYDSSNGNALYANHTVYGQAYPAFSQQSFRPPFSEVGLPYDLKANELYKQKNQKQVLAVLLGSAPAANQYYTSSQFLARGHLAPDADFVYAPLQFATYFYVNICPQWQSINAGNWLAIESMVRKTSGKIKQPLQVFTGTHDRLTLPDVNGNPVEVYLEKSGRIPVPKYLWKIVYNERTREGIAFVAINNPFLDEVYEDDLLCTDICDEYNWSRANFGVIKKGYVFCCNVMDLKRVVTTIPYLRLEGILRA